MTAPGTSSVEAPEASTNNRQFRGTIAALGVGALMVLLALFFPRFVGVAGVGGAILVLSIRSLARAKRLSWWQIALTVLGMFAAAAFVMVLTLAAIVLIRTSR